MTLSAVPPRSRSEVDHVLGGFDRLGVVLDDDDRVVGVAQVTQGLDEPSVVPLMQADRRLVEHVHHAAQFAAELASETDALCLAPGQRVAGTIERQVVEAYRLEKTEAADDFLLHFLGDHDIRASERQSGEMSTGGGHAHRHQVDQAGATHGDRPGFGAQARAVAFRARSVRQVLHVVPAHFLALRLAEAPHHRRDESLVSHRPAHVAMGALPADPEAPISGAEQQELLVLLLEPKKGSIEVERVLLGNRRDHAVGDAAATCHHAGQGCDGAAVHGLLRVGNEQRRVHLRLVPEAVALLAHPERTVEREGLR